MVLYILPPLLVVCLMIISARRRARRFARLEEALLGVSVRARDAREELARLGASTRNLASSLNFTRIDVEGLKRDRQVNDAAILNLSQRVTKLETPLPAPGGLQVR